MHEENPLKKELLPLKDNLNELFKHLRERSSENNAAEKINKISGGQNVGPKSKKDVRAKAEALLKRVPSSEDLKQSKGKEFKKRQMEVATLICLLLEPTNTSDLIQKHALELHRQLTAVPAPSSPSTPYKASPLKVRVSPSIQFS